MCVCACVVCIRVLALNETKRSLFLFFFSIFEVSPTSIHHRGKPLLPRNTCYFLNKKKKMEKKYYANFLITLFPSPLFLIQDAPDRR